VRKWSKRGSRFEVSTVGRDPALALIKGNPYGTVTGPGLIIPSVPAATNIPTNRYLFLLSMWQFNDGDIGRLVGIRQYLTLGALVPNSAGEDSPYDYIVEQPVVTPSWHLSDATVSWHLRRLSKQPNYTSSPFNGPNYCFRQSLSPALLFENDFSEASGYVPPFGGAPPGNILVPDLGAFQDLRFPWQSDQAWDRLDVEIEGPCMVGLFASVQQSTPASRPTLVLPTPYVPGGLPPEEIFLQNFPQAVYRRIAGSLIFEHPSYYEEVGNAEPWIYPVNRRNAEAGNGGDYHPAWVNKRET
jgi:hypothetical protein